VRCINLTSGSCKRRIGSALAYRQSTSTQALDRVCLARADPIDADLERRRFADPARGHGVTVASFGVLIGPRPRHMGVTFPGATPRGRIPSAARSEQGVRPIDLPPFLSGAPGRI